MPPPPPPWSTGVDRILVVCTANVVRSPMGAALLCEALGRRGVAAEVRSAGTYAAVGRPMPRHAAAVLEHRLGRPVEHRSRRFDPREALGADLVVTMTRSQLREVVVAEASLLARAFTLKELVRRAASAPSPRAGEPWPAWLAALGEGRERRALLGDDPGDDVADPFGGPEGGFERCAAELEGLVAALAARAWPAPVAAA